MNKTQIDKMEKRRLFRVEMDNLCPKRLSVFNRNKNDYYLRRTYGITWNDYELLYNKQEGKCLICLSFSPLLAEKNKSLVVDHNHSTGKVRGLLCNACNSMLGFSRDSTENLLKAIEYLKTN